MPPETDKSFLVPFFKKELLPCLPSRYADEGHMIARILGCLVLLSPAPAASAPNLRGKLLFLRCASCHNIGAGTQKIGPNLAGVVGRKAGSLPGYAYSPAMQHTNLVWNEATLDRWLARPSDLVPGTAMAFAGLPAEPDRQAIIAYLRSP
jgi:cytochrome c